MLLLLTHLVHLQFSATAGSIIAGVDSVVTTNAYTAADTGFYQVDLEVSMDSADFAANDNFASNDFSVTDSTYGLDNGVITGYLGTNSFTGGEDGFQMLNLFEFSSTYKLNSVWGSSICINSPGWSKFMLLFMTQLALPLVVVVHLLTKPVLTLSQIFIQLLLLIQLKVMLKIPVDFYF